MLERKKIIYFIITVSLLLAGAYYFLSPFFITLELDESTPVNIISTLVAEAKVIDTPSHPATGLVSVLDTFEGKVLRYEDFKTINGPDLFIYLSTDLKATEFINLGEIKATEGNANYQIPEGVDLHKYHYALVWCKQFGVLFNYADISATE